MNRFRAKRRSLVIALLAFLAGVLLFDSFRMAQEDYRGSRRSLGEVKREILATADLDRLHHEVYRNVGERRWERDVKPAILAEMTRRTAVHIGNPFPAWDDITRWIRRHPEEARSILDRYVGSEPVIDEPVE